MELIETSGVPIQDLPVVAFRSHLRLGTGFSNDAALDPELAQYLAAAVARIEALTGKVLLRRTFRMVLQNWSRTDAQHLPVAPVQSVDAVMLRSRQGVPTPVEPKRFRLIGDRHRPQIVSTGAMLPQLPAGGQAEIEFTAGFGISWDAVPDDLAQAVLLLAAQLFEGRTGVGTGFPAAVGALIGRWTPVRLTAGGHR